MRQRAKELVDRKAVFKVDLAKTFSTAPPDVVREMALVGAIEKPRSLLTQEIVKSTHPSVLKTVYSEVAKSNDAVDKLRRQVNHMGSKDVVEFLRHLIREAPLAAGTFMDEVLLQTPTVQEQSRNPLPQTAAIQEDDQMNVAYVNSKTWDFDYEVAGSMLPWQSALIYQGNSSSLKQALASKSPGCNNAEFTDVKVLDVQGIVRYELFLEMEMLSYQQRVDLFLNCKSLQAIVVFAWIRWSRMGHVVDVAGLVGQFVVILLWWAANINFTGAIGASLQYAIIVCCWSIFTGTVLAGMVLELPYIVSSLGDVMFRTTSRSLDSGSMVHISILLKLGARLLLNLCLSITSWNAWEDTPMHQYKTFMAMVLYISYVYLMMDLSRFHGLGEQILPILNAFSRTAMKTMLSIIFLSWISFMLWSVIEFYGEDAEGESVSLWQLLVESFLSVWVEIGESTFFPSEWVGPRIMYCHVVGALTFVFVNIIMMNIFINICGECYEEEKRRVSGSLVTAKLSICLKTIAQRRFLLGQFSYWFDSAATVVIQRTAAACAALSGALLIVCIATGAWEVVPIVLTVTVANLFALMKLFAILRNTKEKPADAEPGQKWWIDNNYIWVCTPKVGDQVDDRQDEAQEHSRLFVVYSGGDLSATDTHGNKKTIDINGMYKQDSQRNGRPQYLRFSPRQDDKNAPDIRIYWKEEFSGSGDIGRWELTVRDVSIDKYKKPTVFFYLKGCTSPFGQGLKQWKVVNEDDFRGDLFVMTSQDFSAYQHLYGTGCNGSFDRQESCRTSERRNSAGSKANIAVEETLALEAGGKERPGELEAQPEAPPEWLRQLLVKAQLDVDHIDSAAKADMYLTRAAEWVQRETVTESQLYEDNEALEELMNAMELGKYPRRRLRQALAREPVQGPLDLVPPQVKRKIQELGLQDSDIDSVAKLRTVLTQLGMSPEESDVQAIFEEATEKASGTLRLFGLIAFLYREELVAQPAQEPAQRPGQVPPLELE